MKYDNLLEKLTPEIMGELINGGQVIDHLFYDNGCGFILIKRKQPVKETVNATVNHKDGSSTTLALRDFYFGMYETSSADKKLYLATEFVKMSDKQVIKLAHKAFRD